MLVGLETRETRPFRTPDLDLNRRLMNLLSSVRAYLDHTETSIKRELGEDSPQFLRFRQLTSDLYDKSFGYRFLYRFRNFAQHIGLPIDHIDASSTPTTRVFRATVSKTRLLGGFDWGRLVDEIRKLPDEVELTALLVEHVMQLEQLHTKLMDAALPQVRTAAQTVLRYADLLEGHKGFPCLFSRGTPAPATPPSSGSRLTLRHSVLHLDLAKLLLAEADESQPSDGA